MADLLRIAFTFAMGVLAGIQIGALNRECAEYHAWAERDRRWDAERATSDGVQPTGFIRTVAERSTDG